jgi:serine/threonine protein kinase
MRRDFEPSTIGPYSILEAVETRAFHVTYRAERKELGRTVLLRTLRPTVPRTSPHAAELHREAVMLGRLSHPAIQRLYDFVESPEQIYLVLEAVRGVSLGALIQAGRVEPDAAIAIVLSLSRGVAHAHALGVVHQALRPSVVTLTPSGEISLGDFSNAIAPALDLPAIAETVEPGEGAGRLDYQAPEQIAGESAGAPSDVWALGVILHELVAGERPFAAADRRASAQKIRLAAATPLPEATPRALARIVGRCLARHPEDRYPDAGALRVALEEALAAESALPSAVLIAKALAKSKLGDEPVLASSASTSPRRAWAGGPDVMGALRSLALVSALIVGGAVALQAMREQEPVASQATSADSAQAALGPRDRGLLRVVAKPWAEVYVDGELIDVTPIGRPILVTPGKHYVTFRHPKAPDETRTIKITGGQTVFLDVSMRVDRGLGDAGASAKDASASP